jgi:hypothetical protein
LLVVLAVLVVVVLVVMLLTAQQELQILGVGVAELAVGLEQQQAVLAAAVLSSFALRVPTLPLMVQQQSAAQQQELTQVAAHPTPTTHSIRLAR